MNSVFTYYKIVIKARIFLLILAGCVLALTDASAQNTNKVVKKAWTLIDKGNHKEGYELIQDISDEKANEFGDSCVMILNYEKGTCLYKMNNYQDAIPFLKKALLYLEKMPHEDCNYLELIYGLGSCYNNLKDYRNAEKYFRRVIIRGNVQGFKCMITIKTLSELTEVYKKLGYEKLAQACAEKIDYKTNNISTENWSNRADALLNLANSYEKQGKFEEEIETYHELLDLVESNAGKNNEEYLTYCSILYQRLILNNRNDEAIPFLEDVISIGKSYKIHNIYVCDAYENYLEIMAKRGKNEIVEKTLPEAIKYFQQTKEYDWNSQNIYERVGNAFIENDNQVLGVKYLEKEWNGHIANTIRSLTNLGSYYYKSNPSKALAYYKEAESQIELASNEETKCSILENIMYLYNTLNNFKEAVIYAEKAASFIKAIKDDDYYARHLTNWAVYCQKNSNMGKVGELFSELNGLMPRLSNETKAAIYSNKGFIYIGDKKYAESIDVLKKGVSFVKEKLGESNQWLAMMYHNLGRAYMLQQDNANALFYLNKSKEIQILLNGKAMQRTIDYINECESK